MKTAQCSILSDCNTTELIRPFFGVHPSPACSNFRWPKRTRFLCDSTRATASFSRIFTRLAKVFSLLLFSLSLACHAPEATAATEAPSEHIAAHTKKPKPWPGGVIPYDISKLTPDQQDIVQRAIQRWTDSGAQISFVPRVAEPEYVFFTGNLTNGNNTSLVGYEKGKRAEINITAFWWKQQEWMIVHELGHVLGLFHEHQRWDRDDHITVHYENIKPGRSSDYDWIPRTNWIVTTTPYDFHSIMHYRICWASKCESECHDGVGSSPCSVLVPLDSKYDKVIGQWGDNKVSDLDAEKLRLIYGVKKAPAPRSSTPSSQSQ